MDDNTLTIKADGREFTFPKSEAWKVLSQVSAYTRRVEVVQALDAIADRNEHPMTDEEFDELADSIAEDMENRLDECFESGVIYGYEEWINDKEIEAELG